MNDFDLEHRFVVARERMRCVWGDEITTRLLDWEDSSAAASIFHSEVGPEQSHRDVVHVTPRGTVFREYWIREGNKRWQKCRYRKLAAPHTPIPTLQ